MQIKIIPVSMPQMSKYIHAYEPTTTQFTKDVLQTVPKSRPSTGQNELDSKVYMQDGDKWFNTLFSDVRSRIWMELVAGIIVSMSSENSSLVDNKAKCLRWFGKIYLVKSQVFLKGQLYDYASIHNSHHKEHSLSS